MTQDAPTPPAGTVAGANQEGFLKLYASAQPALQHFIAAHIPDLHEVDDLMQEVAVCLWKKFSQYVPGSSFKSWAIRVAQYEVLHARRAHARHPSLRLPQLTEDAVTRYAEMDLKAVEERRRALEGCLERLPSAQRDLILARYRGERSGRDLAQEWKRKENAVWVQLFRIRAALRHCVDGKLAGSGEVSA
jgi:RNA polymerase sigma-70 factor (ECF subfamily)